MSVSALGNVGIKSSAALDRSLVLSTVYPRFLLKHPEWCTLFWFNMCPILLVVSVATNSGYIDSNSIFIN